VQSHNEARRHHSRQKLLNESRIRRDETNR
jgi:hypothetical protein